jgi:hypothetical protein
VNENDDRSLGLDLGIDNECLDGAAADLEGDILVVAGEASRRALAQSCAPTVEVAMVARTTPAARGRR